MNTSNKCKQTAVAFAIAAGCLTAQEESTIPPPDYFKQYKENVAKAKNRRGGNTVPNQVVKSRTPGKLETADRIHEFTDQVTSKTYELSGMVMMDNTIGKAFPGSFLWTTPIREGRLNEVPQIPGRPPVRVTFTGLRKVVPQAGPLDVVVRGEMVGGDIPMDVQTLSPLSFEHNGSFSDFEAKRQEVLEGRVNAGGRFSATIKVASSLEEAVSSLGLSANYWKASLGFGIDDLSNRTRSIALLSIDQVLYSATTDAPPSKGFLPDELIQAHPDLAQSLAVGSVSGGEVAYVRRVDYGRRILVSLASASSKQKFEEQLNFAIKAIGAGAEIDLSRADTSVWDSMEAKIIVIGGGDKVAFSGLITAGISGFISSLREVLEAVQKDEATARGVPISFEMAYIDDASPMQVYEVTEFSNRIPGATFGKITKDFPIATDGSCARVIRQDNEIDSDDWTLVKIESQRLRLSDDRNTAYFTLKWRAYEGNGDRTTTRTIIESEKTFDVPLPKPAERIVSQTEYGPSEQWYAGRSLFNFYPFPDNGLLRGVSVKFDAPGRNDSSAQALQGTLSFTYWQRE